MVKMTRSKTFQAYLPSCHRTYSCIHCRAHLANHDELISKSFQGSQGRAYLFNSVVNVGCGPAEERVLLTGLHAVADIYCENCKTTLGWKYWGRGSEHPKIGCGQEQSLDPRVELGKDTLGAAATGFGTHFWQPALNPAASCLSCVHFPLECTQKSWKQNCSSVRGAEPCTTERRRHNLCPD
uniref:Yippee like 2 n=1 Tax=Junco hyemalis TaxID=40217 RepID=A0A8C5ICY7_JUNHY